MRAPGTRHGGGMTFERLRQSVSRDAYSDFLPMVAWVEEEDAFLCIDDGWGQAWELVPSAYLFAHVHQALLGLLNIHFAPGTVVQLHCFADPLIDDALDAFLDLKSRPDPLIQASARRTRDYLREGTQGLDALHGTDRPYKEAKAKRAEERAAAQARWLADVAAERDAHAARKSQ